MSVIASDGEQKEQLRASWKIIQYMQQKEESHRKNASDDGRANPLPDKISLEEAIDLGIVDKIPYAT